jgi:hypothetical protein
MTRKTLEYIVRHFELAYKALNKNCVPQKCKNCPFMQGNYCTKKMDMGENVGFIKRHLENNA